MLDYGFGNIRSAERALVHAGASVTVTSDLRLAAAADGLVVPGVGAYAACMAGIEEIDAGPVIAERVARPPVLGICVGMQIMFEAGDEHGVVTRGLGLLPGRVTRLDADRVPLMGWNTVTPPSIVAVRRYLDRHPVLLRPLVRRPARRSARVGRGHGDHVGSRRRLCRRGGERRLWRRPSSIRRSRVTRVRCCCATGSAR